ncbi:hypothetical protein GGTG_04535 [Gaeumannomyces tritici R3-111a-1]|uniref:Heterokaryon incompatibility domain-containing protein n=1 Tax=Gaeumannomyces tritici (strain R3-111a-1) TaxID=644352 RepID=J3NTD6_GAET3|nr:hypothetical protein GGTG_04535 [Gaeumannomyces tritici R3-111a-1]EJT79451.1 hypothetical protein GGTG_04535 [Gaeumannomyces tritici R3-111a-1]
MATLTYQYRPIKGDTQKGILRIYPATANAPLVGELVHGNFDDQPTYDALSYTWGNLDMCERIVLHEGREQLELPITANLNAALKRMRARFPQESTLIWADGMCVNQADLQERGQQVQLMGRIYTQCQQGLIYLGEEADGSELIPDFLPALVAPDDAGGLAGAEDLPPSSNPGCRALTMLYRRPWFRRIWFIQESALPADVRIICGGWKMSCSMRNKAKSGFSSIQFTEAEITYIPLEDCTAGAIISNCVVNLVPEAEKQPAFDEMARLLKPGGRVAISNVLARKPLPENLRQSAPTQTVRYGIDHRSIRSIVPADRRREHENIR